MKVDIAVTAGVAVALVSFWAGWQGHTQAAPDYTRLGSSEGCTPSDHWPCWKVDRAGCLWFANSTAIVRYCQGNDGGWTPYDPTVGVTEKP